MQDAQSLGHVLWLGGSPCAGKSTIARCLANEHGLQLYVVDEALLKQLDRVSPAQHPGLYKWTHSSWDELWMQPADVLLQESISVYGEHLDLVLEDLYALPSDPILVDGTALLPDRIAPLLEDGGRGAWLVPSEGFQRDHYASRVQLLDAILSTCSDPHQAFARWMARDVAFAEWIGERTRACGLPCRVVDGTQSIEQNAFWVAEHLGLI